MYLFSNTNTATLQLMLVAFCKPLNRMLWEELSQRAFSSVRGHYSSEETPPLIHFSLYRIVSGDAKDSINMKRLHVRFYKCIYSNTY